MKKIDELILEDYLYDSGKDANIIDLAKRLGFRVFSQMIDTQEYVSFTVVGDESFVYDKVICLNLHVANGNIGKFIISYQIADYLINGSDQSKYYSNFKIEELDFNAYNLAKKIYDRSIKYKNDKQLRRKK